MALFCAAIRRDSVSLSRFSFLSHVYVFLCEIFIVYRLKYPCSCYSSNFYFLAIFVLVIFVLHGLFLVTLICTFFIELSVVMLAKERHGEHKGQIEKHVYSSNRNKIQVNLVKREFVNRKLRVHYASGITRGCVTWVRLTSLTLR